MSQANLHIIQLSSLAHSEPWGSPHCGFGRNSSLICWSSRVWTTIISFSEQRMNSSHVTYLPLFAASGKKQLAFTWPDKSAEMDIKSWEYIWHQVRAAAIDSLIGKHVSKQWAALSCQGAALLASAIEHTLSPKTPTFLLYLPRSRDPSHAKDQAYSKISIPSSLYSLAITLAFGWRGIPSF
jgi:hypothetical protein